MSPKKVPDFVDQSLFIVGDHTLKQLQRKLPRDYPNIEQFRDHLHVKRLTSANKKRRTWLLLWKPETPEPVETVLLHIRPKKGTAPSPAIQILVKYSPWHPALLPFKPKRKEAIVAAEEVDEKTAKARMKLLFGTKKEWSLQLRRLGVSVKFPRGLKAMRDNLKSGETDVSASFTARDAWRLEFGYSRVRARPAWRPVLRGVVRTGFFGIIKSSKWKYKPVNVLLSGKLQKLPRPGTIGRDELDIARFSKAVHGSL